MAKKKTTRKKTGRPLAKIDPTTVEGLAKIGCTVEEIAAFVGCVKSTISTRFQTELCRGREHLNMSIRRQLYERMKVSDRVLMHVADRYLGPIGQTDTATLAALYSDPRIKSHLANGNGKANGSNGTAIVAGRRNGQPNGVPKRSNGQHG